jgi:hypothetical protein
MFKVTAIVTLITDFAKALMGYKNNKRDYRKDKRHSGESWEEKHPAIENLEPRKPEETPKKEDTKDTNHPLLPRKDEWFKKLRERRDHGRK